MRKPIILTAIVAGSMIFTGLATYAGYLWMTYIDKSIDTGEIYGLSIGDTKRQTFEKLPAILENIGVGSQELFVEITVDDSTAKKLAVAPGNHVLVQTRFDTVGFDDWSEQDSWTIFVGGSYQNFLRLSFCGQKLCRIYRHRKYIEFP